MLLLKLLLTQLDSGMATGARSTLNDGQAIGAKRWRWWLGIEDKTKSRAHKSRPRVWEKATTCLALWENQAWELRSFYKARLSLLFFFPFARSSPLPPQLSRSAHRSTTLLNSKPHHLALSF